MGNAIKQYNKNIYVACFTSQLITQAALPKQITFDQTNIVWYFMYMIVCILWDLASSSIIFATRLTSIWYDIQITSIILVCFSFIPVYY
jgi:hypothetical protein